MTPNTRGRPRAFRDECGPNPRAIGEARWARKSDFALTVAQPLAGISNFSFLPAMATMVVLASPEL